jgi:multidrug efflux pump subunit AcrB
MSWVPDVDLWVKIAGALGGGASFLGLVRLAQRALELRFQERKELREKDALDENAVVSHYEALLKAMRESHDREIGMMQSAFQFQLKTWQNSSELNSRLAQELDEALKQHAQNWAKERAELSAKCDEDKARLLARLAELEATKNEGGQTE